MSKRILICGDSFAADWTVKYKGLGWPNLLSQKFDVTNLARAGVCEYKIYNQLLSANISDFDIVIISHTSPYRLYVKEHPIHSQDSLHGECDLIYTDLKDAVNTYKQVQPIIEYFEKYFDLDYAKFVHGLICEKIENFCQPFSHKVINLITFEEQYQFKNSLSFVDLFKTNRGKMNHFDTVGNQKIFETIANTIKEKLK